MNICSGYIPWIALSASLSFGIVTFGQGQVNEELRSEVEQLVSQLDDTDVAKQEAAEVKLQSLDPSAIAYFPILNLPSDVSAGTLERIGKIREILVRRGMDSNSKASQVTLEGTMDLNEALHEIERQTGNQILDYRNRFGDSSPLTVTINAKNKNFWDVVDEMLPKKGLVLYPFPGEPHSIAIISDPNRVGQSIVSHDRFLRVEAVKLFAVRDLRDPFQTGLRLTLEIVWEPRIKPIFVKHHLEKFEAKDDLGQILHSTTKGQVEAPVLSGVAGVECTIPIELPSRRATRLATIHGETEVYLPGEIVRLEIPNILADGAQARMQNTVVEVNQVEADEEVLDIRLTVRQLAEPKSVPSHYGWTVEHRVFLQKRSGEVLEPIGTETLFQKSGEFGIAYKFELTDPKDWSLIYETPSTIVPISFQYDFKDVLLP